MHHAFYIVDRQARIVEYQCPAYSGYSILRGDAVVAKKGVFDRVCNLVGNIPTGILFVIAWGGSLLGFWQAPVFAILVVALSTTGMVRNGEMDAAGGFVNFLVCSVILGFLYPALYVVRYFL